MSKMHNNGWKIHRRTLSSTESAIHALQLAYSSVIGDKVIITCSGRFFSAAIFLPDKTNCLVHARTLPRLAARINAVIAEWLTSEREREHGRYQDILECYNAVCETNRMLASNNATLADLLVHRSGKQTEKLKTL